MQKFGTDPTMRLMSLLIQVFLITPKNFRYAFYFQYSKYLSMSMLYFTPSSSTCIFLSAINFATKDIAGV